MIHVLTGRIRLDLEGRAIDLEQGRLVSIDRGMPSAVTALDESSFLIWVARRETAAS